CAMRLPACSCPPPRPPSSPTRRSSDLVHAQRRDGEDVEDADIDVGDHPAIGERHDRPGREREHGGDERREEEHPLVRARRNDRLDRKSTRLNSSHVKISYAVFCLKKKK